MTAKVVRAGMELLDELRGEDLVLGIFSDERPPRGLAGMVDWRLCGRITKLIVDGAACGEVGERLLVADGQRLGDARVFLFGLGARAAYAKNAERAASEMARVVRAAGPRNVVVGLPGPSGVSGPAVRVLLSELGESVSAVVDEDGAMASWLEAGGTGS